MNYLKNGIIKLQIQKGHRCITGAFFVWVRLAAWVFAVFYF